MNDVTTTAAMPASSSSSSRRSSVVRSSTLLPSAIRGCGSNVMTVGSVPGRANRVDHGQVAPMDAVEAADGDRARQLLELGRVVDDPHTSLASASSGGMMRSGSASSIPNGPISVRRSDTQCPPRRSAIARMYVPDPTSRSSRATPSA